MRVLVAMSGGVDSSVAAALCLAAGHEVTGATLKLWGGPQDAGCCSVADVDDARRVAQQLGIDHHVFNLTEDFEATVVAPYVAAHAAGRTPNPCIECNRHVKFDRLLARAERLGFDALATGHHARVTPPDAPGGPWGLHRGADRAKDQSYVLSMLGQAQLARLLLPVGELSKTEVRARAAALGLRTADKPDSQDVCFIHGEDGRRRFLAGRLPLTPGTVETADGRRVGRVDALELVTVGQRRGLGNDADGGRRYVLAVDVAARRVVVGDAGAATSDGVDLVDGSLTWTAEAPDPGAPVLAQSSAHGAAVAGTFLGARIAFDAPARRVAPGQTVALYDPARPDAVLGAGIAA